MRKQLTPLTLLLAAILISSPSFAATYNVDKDHSTVSFKIRHLFSYVTGTFNDFKGTIDYTPGKPEEWKAQGTVDATTIDTNVPERDKHLRSKDFFDVESFPAIEFATTKVISAQDGKAKAEGLLTIHGVQKPVVLDVDIHGEGKDPWGNVRSGFTAKTTINRKDFGLGWNQALESGKLLVGEEVEITLEIEGILP